MLESKWEDTSVKGRCGWDVKLVSESVGSNEDVTTLELRVSQITIVESSDPEISIHGSSEFQITLLTLSLWCTNYLQVFALMS